MNINIYEDYTIKYKVISTTLSEENETKYDNIFNHEIFENSQVINGGELMELISDKISDKYISEFVIVGKELNFEMFNYNTGETESICIEILGSDIHETK